MKPLDVKRITAAVAARHGMLLKADDPALVLVTINECVLAESFDQLEQRAQILLSEMDASFAKMQEGAATHLTEAARESAAAVREELQRDIQAAKLDASEALFKLQTAHSRTVVWRWLAMGILSGVGLFLGGALIGWFFK
jgi:hypothetical protein